LEVLTKTRLTTAAVSAVCASIAMILKPYQDGLKTIILNARPGIINTKDTDNG
jgi:hypothetical protein